jgi:hypothetical protein
MIERVFINLTNGLEYSEAFDGVIRIQSTACEQKRWNFIIEDLDYNFLLNLYIGSKVKVIDYGAKKEVPRAVYQGLAWIEYVCNKYWFNYSMDKVFVKKYNSVKYFEDQYLKLSDSAKKKLDYFKRFESKVGKIHLISETKATVRDGDNSYYSNKLYEISNLGKTND